MGYTSHLTIPKTPLNPDIVLRDGEHFLIEFDKRRTIYSDMHLAAADFMSQTSECIKSGGTVEPPKIWVFETPKELLSFLY